MFCQLDLRLQLVIMQMFFVVGLFCLILVIALADDSRERHRPLCLPRGHRCGRNNFVRCCGRFVCKRREYGNGRTCQRRHGNGGCSERGDRCKRNHECCSRRCRPRRGNSNRKTCR
ncbi:uncharacterized protein SJCHGC09800-like isoform X2 [Gigantopelta aegis]|uniref:uncharacterized protein SJCHGC09800-like isoform X2 n=1 Tax=Gigantopelta aegis TaxID=1735272 RepID=UPI001B887A72|nr:uncharacterized protein SJCHGC09800-like isoform X2 [Gigantopelta aegis]